MKNIKAAKYLGIAAVAVAICGSQALAGSSPISESISARRFAALPQVQQTDGKDPIITGSNSQIIAPGSTAYFFAETSASSISKCSEVNVVHADGGAFDPDNTGKLVVHGMDVSVLFLNSDSSVTQSFFLGAVSPNNALFAGGYAVTSPQSVAIQKSDLPSGSINVAIIVEGDVTNTDTKPQSVDAMVEGIIQCF